MDDHWRAFSYGKCTSNPVDPCFARTNHQRIPGLRAIRNHPTRIKSYREARSIRGVGEKTALKANMKRSPKCYKYPLIVLLQIMEILQTGNLRRIGYEKTEDVEATHLFQGIYGVGMQNHVVFPI
jgi:DNA polymerase lambda